jgi:hypothetical protein
LLTAERNYGVGMVDKVDWNVPIFEDYAVFIDVVSMRKEMGAELKRQDFDAAIANSQISARLKSKYEHLEEMMLQDDPKWKQVGRNCEDSYGADPTFADFVGFFNFYIGIYKLI